ncbi:MAG TPA: hypothetical protein VGG75_05645 [Trebonia sp.]
MSTPVLVQHDPGCRYARESHGGHDDAARRLSDTVNMHIAVGSRRGVIACRLSDGTSDGTVYESRADAVRHQHHNERWYAFIRLQPSSMSVCAAASVLRMHRQSAALRADRDAPNGGLELIPRLNAEDQERQLAALAGLVRLPVALGKGQ